LLTGATGFIGSACLNCLVRGDSDIHAVNRKGRGPFEGRVAWHAAELRDPDSARALIAAVRPTHLLHTAWIATPGVYMSSPQNSAWLEAGAALVRAFGEAGGRRFVGIGTCAEYDWSASKFVEDETPLRPQSPYGRAKVAMWEAVRAGAAAHGFAAAWGRIFLPYGPADAPERLIPSVIMALREGRTVETTDGNQARDFIFVEDAADLLRRLLLSDVHGAFNVGTGTASTVRSAITMVAESLGGLDRVKFGARPRQPGEPASLVADMRKVETQLSWRAKVELRTGLAICVDQAGARPS